jgi:hypothetical protein
MKITDPKLRASILLVRGGFTVSEAAKLLSLSVEMSTYTYASTALNMRGRDELIKHVNRMAKDMTSALSTTESE